MITNQLQNDESILTTNIKKMFKKTIESFNAVCNEIYK